MCSNLERIEFEVEVSGLEDTLQSFTRFINPDDTEDTVLGYYTYHAFMMREKLGEADEDIAPIRGTRKPSNRGTRRKATAHAKNRRKILATYADDEIRTNSGKVINTGYRTYEKGDKLYTRKGRGFRDKFTEDPFNPWDFEDEDTMLNLTDNGDGYYSDLEITNAIDEARSDDWELDDDWDDDWDDDYQDDHQDEIQDLKNYAHQLEHEIEKLYEFIKEYNLNKLFDQWEKSHN